MVEIVTLNVSSLTSSTSIDYCATVGVPLALPFALITLSSLTSPSTGLVDLYHAKQAEAFDFCYVKDIVLGILELISKLIEYFLLQVLLTKLR
ncbi:hypothetical protein CR513_11686, partial [Mucuna pruriens]